MDTFDSEAFKGKQALVIANGTVKAVAIGSLKSTSTIC